MAWSSPRWTGYLPILRYTCFGALVRIINVLNDRTLAPSTGFVQGKHQLAGADRYWPLAAFQSAQRAAGAPQAVRGSQLSQPSPSPQCSSDCVMRLSRIEVDVEQRPTALRRA